MYFWVPSITCPKLKSLYINYMTNGFVPVVQKKILDIMLPVRTSSLRDSILVDSLVYFSSYFCQVSCLFFEPTSSLCESILVKSLVYFSSLHLRLASLCQLSLLSIFRAYILALRVYFSQLKQTPFVSLFQQIQTKPDPYRQAGRYRVAFTPLGNYRWFNKYSRYQRLLNLSQFFFL